ncbi:unnamed protein product [Tenebrio molitor]|nr:unnamed protein product [Tenebrio molitor]
MCNQEDKENSGGKEGRLQKPCEFPESTNTLSSASVYINKEFSKPTTSINQCQDTGCVAKFLSGPFHSILSFKNIGTSIERRFIQKSF